MNPSKVTTHPLNALDFLTKNYALNCDEFLDNLIRTLDRWEHNGAHAVPETATFFNNKNAFNEMKATFSTEGPQGACFHLELEYPLTKELSLHLQVEYLWKEKNVLGKMTWISCKVINSNTPSIPLAASAVSQSNWPLFHAVGFSHNSVLGGIFDIKEKLHTLELPKEGIKGLESLAAQFLSLSPMAGFEYVTVGPIGGDKETFIRRTNSQTTKAEENKMLDHNNPVVKFIAEQKNKHELDLSKFALIVGGALTFWLDAYHHTKVADKLFKTAEGFENMAVQPLLRPSKEGAINGMEFRHSLGNDLEFVIETWFWSNVKLAQVRVFVERVPSSSRIQVRSDNPQMSIIDFHVKLEEMVSHYVNTSIPMIGGIKAVLEKAELLASVTKTPEQLDKVTSNAELPHAPHEKTTPVIDSAIDFAALGEAMRKKRIQMDWAEAERIIKSEILQQYAPNAAKNLCQEIPFPDGECDFRAEYARNEQIQNINLALDKEHREYLLSLLKSQQGMCDYISPLPRNTHPLNDELVKQLKEFIDTLKVKFITPKVPLVKGDIDPFIFALAPTIVKHIHRMKKENEMSKENITMPATELLKKLNQYSLFDMTKFTTAVAFSLDLWERHYGNKVNSGYFFQNPHGFENMNAVWKNEPGDSKFVFDYALANGHTLHIEVEPAPQDISSVVIYVSNGAGLDLFKTLTKKFPRATFSDSEIPVVQNLLDVTAANNIIVK